MVEHNGADRLEHPLAELKILSAIGEKTGIKVAIVDDEVGAYRWGRVLARDGFEVLCVDVHSDILAPEYKSRQLFNQIIEWGPDWVLSDIGLGHVKGTDLLSLCREAGIGAIAYTGQGRNTAETLQVSDHILPKPIDYEKLLRILKSPRVLRFQT